MLVDIEIPNTIKNKYVVYTKSNCLYCTKIKELLQYELPPPSIIDCDIYLQTNKSHFLQFIQSIATNSCDKQITTFPIVFKHGKYLGGYTETKKYKEQQCVNWEEEEF